MKNHELLTKLSSLFYGRDLGLKLYPVTIAPFSLINRKDTLYLCGDKCLFCFMQSIINTKQKWGFYARIYNWKSILWRIQ